MFNKTKIKMKKLLLSLVAILGLGIAASAANYSIDEQEIDAMIETATEVTPLALEAATPGLTDPSVKIGTASPSPIIAFILSVIPVTGWLAVHRMYMGTSALTVVLNIITGAGFGIVYVVDWVCLLVGVLDDNIGQYCNNPHWWMLLNLI